MYEGSWSAAQPSLAAALEARSHGAERTALPVTLPYAAGCRLRGLGSGVGSAGLVLTSLFIFSQMSIAPAIALQLCIVGMLLSGGGIALAYRAAQRLFGGVTVHEQGIVLSPSFAGFSVPWRRLRRWEVCDQAFPAPASPAVRLWVEGDPVEFVVPENSLSAKDLATMRRLLREYASERGRGE